MRLRMILLPPCSYPCHCLIPTLSLCLCLQSRPSTGCNTFMKYHISKQIRTNTSERLVFHHLLTAHLTDGIVSRTSGDGVAVVTSRSKREAVVTITAAQLLSNTAAVATWTVLHSPEGTKITRFNLHNWHLTKSVSRFTMKVLDTKSRAIYNKKKRFKRQNSPSRQVCFVVTHSSGDVLVQLASYMEIFNNPIKFDCIFQDSKMEVSF